MSHVIGTPSIPEMVIDRESLGVSLTFELEGYHPRRVHRIECRPSLAADMQIHLVKKLEEALLKALPYDYEYTGLERILSEGRYTIQYSKSSGLIFTESPHTPQAKRTRELIQEALGAELEGLALQLADALQRFWISDEKLRALIRSQLNRVYRQRLLNAATREDQTDLDDEQISILVVNQPPAYSMVGGDAGTSVAQRLQTHTDAVDQHLNNGHVVIQGFPEDHPYYEPLTAAFQEHAKWCYRLNRATLKREAMYLLRKDLDRLSEVEDGTYLDFNEATALQPAPNQTLMQTLVLDILLQLSPYYSRWRSGPGTVSLDDLAHAVKFSVTMTMENAGIFVD